MAKLFKLSKYLIGLKNNKTGESFSSTNFWVNINHYTCYRAYHFSFTLVKPRGLSACIHAQPDHIYPGLFSSNFRESPYPTLTSGRFFSVPGLADRIRQSFPLPPHVLGEARYQVPPFQFELSTIKLSMYQAVNVKTI